MSFVRNIWKNINKEVFNGVMENPTKIVWSLEPPTMLGKLPFLCKLLILKSLRILDSFLGLPLLHEKSNSTQIEVSKSLTSSMVLGEF